jgi:hypothetical protein
MQPRDIRGDMARGIPPAAGRRAGLHEAMHVHARQMSGHHGPPAHGGGHSIMQRNGGIVALKIVVAFDEF